MTITTTLNKIRACDPCDGGWKTLLRHLGKPHADDDEFPMSVILDSNGFDDCLWALRTRPDLYRLWTLYAVDCARQVQHLMSDPRSIAALDVAERYALGKATNEELAAARAAAWAVVEAAKRDARAAEREAARSVVEAARAAAWAVVEAAEREAARSVVEAARAAVEAKQTAALRQLLNTVERPDWNKLEMKGLK